MAVVDAQDRDVPRSRHPRACQKGPVAAQRENQVGLLQEFGHHLRFGVALQLDGVDLPCPHRAKHAVDLVLLHARPSDGADLHNFSGRSWTKISRLPSAPVTSDGASALTPYPMARQDSRKRERAASIASGLRTMPPFPTSALPTSNWGLKRATTSASGAARRSPRPRSPCGRGCAQSRPRREPCPPG